MGASTNEKNQQSKKPFLCKEGCDRQPRGKADEGKRQKQGLLGGSHPRERDIRNHFRQSTQHHTGTGFLERRKPPNWLTQKDRKFWTAQYLIKKWNGRKVKSESFQWKIQSHIQERNDAHLSHSSCRIPRRTEHLPACGTMPQAPAIKTQEEKYRSMFLGSRDTKIDQEMLTN